MFILTNTTKNNYLNFKYLYILSTLQKFVIFYLVFFLIKFFNLYLLHIKKDDKS